LYYTLLSLLLIKGEILSIDDLHERSTTGVSSAFYSRAKAFRCFWLERDVLLPLGFRRQHVLGRGIPPRSLLLVTVQCTTVDGENEWTFCIYEAAVRR
jgi:hypothetical protein